MRYNMGYYPKVSHLLKPRLLKLSDFPPALQDGYILSALKYWDQHYIDVTSLSHISTVYPTRRGICWVLYGGLGYQERLTITGVTQRFIFPLGVDVSGMVYMPNPENANEELIITEGTTDALAVEQVGFRAVSILGTMLTTQRVRLLQSLVRNSQRVFYIPDNDGPGLSAINRLIRAGLPVKVRYLPDTAKDLCNMVPAARATYLRAVLI